MPPGPPLGQLQTGNVLRFTLAAKLLCRPLQPFEASYLGVVDSKHFWVGACSSALDADARRERGIEFVVTAARGLALVSLDSTNPAPPTFACLALADRPDELLLSSGFEALVRFLDAIPPASGVLVHCVSGVSRSVAVCAAYMMLRLRCPYAQALAAIRSVRPRALPNSGFQAQLALLQEARSVSDARQALEQPPPRHLRREA